ncbi:MAG: TetR/AcrR family transcriptional regulator [Actinophytocola sp.]|uniref:TetR/AcrR family transcriptional regulator n=1 Tax=Actinophytocola sp. TaxID=1872138 RepID=UPI003D6B702D
MTTLTPAAERLLTAAGELFYTRGIHAVGVDLIAETAGTTKKTLYDRFGSKDQLVALYLRRRFERWCEFVERWLDEHGRDPERVLDALESWLRDNTHGCAFVNAHAEIGRADHPAIGVVRAEKQWMRSLYERLAGSAELGARLHLVHEGAIIAWSVGGQADALDHARAAARDLVSRAS